MGRKKAKEKLYDDLARASRNERSFGEDLDGNDLVNEIHQNEVKKRQYRK